MHDENKNKIREAARLFDYSHEQFVVRFVGRLSERIEAKQSVSVPELLEIYEQASKLDAQRLKPSLPTNQDTRRKTLHRPSCFNEKKIAASIGPI